MHRLTNLGHELTSHLERVAALVKACQPFADAATFLEQSPDYTEVNTPDVVEMVRPDGYAFHLAHRHCVDLREALLAVTGTPEVESCDDRVGSPPTGGKFST